MNDISVAVDILKKGGLVAFPTETVYGLGADATNAQAIERIFSAKGRPSTNPLIVHVADLEVARRFAGQWPDMAGKLAQRFWPGPLTLVVPRGELIVPAVSAGLATVGLRCPDHHMALDLLRAFDGPLAAPSANRSTRVSPTTARHVRDELGDSVDAILDGGACRIGIESTVLDLTRTPPLILRPGAVTRMQLEQEIGPIQVFEGALSELTAAVSPGQMALHYSPRAVAWRFEPAQWKKVIDLSMQYHPGLSVILSVGDNSRDREVENMVLALPGSADEYARTLYATLRDLDEQQTQVIWIEMPPEEPAWMAVRDRLQRATKPLP